jgi:hypothetical protein
MSTRRTDNSLDAVRHDRQHHHHCRPLSLLFLPRGRYPTDALFRSLQNPRASLFPLLVKATWQDISRQLTTSLGSTRTDARTKERINWPHDEVTPSCRPPESYWRRLREGTRLHSSILLVLSESARWRHRTSGYWHRRNAPPPVSCPYATIDMIPFKHQDAFSPQGWRPAVATTTTMVRVQQQQEAKTKTDNKNKRRHGA